MKKMVVCYMPLFVILFLTASFSCFAQYDTASNNRTFALYAITPAFATGASSALNGTLLQNGYPRLPRGHFNWA
jgi:hypothetical protein